MAAPPGPTGLLSTRRLVLYFVLLAALLPEGITGSTPPLRWLNPVQALLNFGLYGSGVLVVRELALRWKAGWPGILLLGAAYGIVEEGLAVTTFFNPYLPQVGALGSYGRLAGVNWVWAVWLTIFHASVSMAFPIFLIEWHFPALRGRPLLSKRGSSIALVILALVTVTINGIVSLGSSYRAGVAEYAGALLVIAALAYAAYRGHGRLWERLPTRRMPSHTVFAMAGFLFYGASFLVYSGGPSLGFHPALTFLEGGLLLFVPLLLLRATLGREDAERHRFSLVAGGIGLLAAFAVLVGLGGGPDFFGLPAVGPAFIAYVLWLYRTKGPNHAIAATA